MKYLYWIDSRNQNKYKSLYIKILINEVYLLGYKQFKQFEVRQKK